MHPDIPILISLST